MKGEVILNLFQDPLINPYCFLRRLRNKEFIGEILKQVQDDPLHRFRMTHYTVYGPITMVFTITIYR